MLVRAHVFIAGRVQGVFFRMYTQREAQALGLSGWVRNVYSEKLPIRPIRQALRPRAQGRVAQGRQAQDKKVEHSKLVEFTGVEAVVEGEKEAVNEMIAWCWSESPSAKVTDVQVVWEDPEGLRGFEILG